MPNPRGKVPLSPRKLTTHEALYALNDAVEDRAVRELKPLKMTDADWEEWTVLVGRKAAQFQHQDDGGVRNAVGLLPRK